MSNLLLILFNLLFLLSFCVSSLNAKRKTYEGYKIIEGEPTTQSQIKWLQSLENENIIEVLKGPLNLHRKFEILISKETFNYVEKHLRYYKLNYKIVNENVTIELKRLYERLDEKKAFDLNDFNTFEDIMDALQNFQSNCPNGAYCSIRSYGNTNEQRPIRTFMLEKDNVPNKKIIWFDSGMHAREWLGVATGLKVLDRFIRQEDQDVIDLFNKYNIYFTPVMNPDGYDYTFTSDRFWRKNRTPNTNPACPGTDLNRNYAVNWGTDGASTNPCSTTYAGRSAASERETRIFQDIAKALGNQVLAWTSIHTFAQMVLTPYGNTTSSGSCYRSDDYADLKSAADAFANGIEEVYGTTWQRGTFCEVLYPGSGTSTDYVKTHANIKYSFTPELRGPGFDPNKDQIPLSYAEFWNGVKAMIARIEAIEGNKRIPLK